MGNRHSAEFTINFTHLRITTEFHIVLQILKTPTIEEEAPYSLSPSPAPPSPPHSPLPPPAMLEFSEQAMQADMRTRMSSFSGRPIKSTGICLQFGEDDSSSDSDRESITESG